MRSTSRFAATAELSFRSVPWPTMKRLVSSGGTPGAICGRAPQQEFGHARVISRRLAVFDRARRRAA